MHSGCIFASLNRFFVFKAFEAFPQI